MNNISLMASRTWMLLQMWSTSLRNGTTSEAERKCTGLGGTRGRRTLNGRFGTRPVENAKFKMDRRTMRMARHPKRLGRHPRGGSDSS
jgi:hypothetical protein